jgi:hypothetical protein
LYSVGYLWLKAMFATLGLRLSLAKRKILKDFNNLLDNHFNQPQHILCGHNAKIWYSVSGKKNDY